MSISDENSSSGAVAIIGMAGRFPGANDLDAFWNNLSRGVDSISHFQDNELEPSRLESPGIRALPNYVRARATLDRPDLFDAGFFTIIPREAAVMDPQQRLFLETAWTALESAGYDPASYPKLIGVWAGMNSPTYYQENVVVRPDVVAQTGFLPTTMANGKDYLTTRISYKLNLRGPSVNVYSSEATSLVAVCQAFSALVNHQCDIALAGGASIVVPQRKGYLHLADKQLSADGRCRPFDAESTGTVPGDGLGLVVLKRLEEAIADGDHIYAVIRGVALSNEGAERDSTGENGANRKADVIAMAQAVAGIEPATVSYVEADGTGIPSADATELAALQQVFGGETAPGQTCYLGSLKGNIGHLAAAAGVAGLIKTALSLHHRELPPTLHFEHPPSALGSGQGPLLVNTELRPWPKGATPRRAGVSSFGSDGTNAHVILEEAPRVVRPSSSRREQLIVLSARSERALDAATAQLVEHLQTHPDERLTDVTHTLQSGRRAFPFRRALVATSVKEALELISANDPLRVINGHPEKSNAKVAFLFPGQGSQYVGMTSGLYQTEPEFAAELDACAQALQPVLGFDLRTLIFAPPSKREESERRLAETAITQPALFAVELAMARLWMSWGFDPAFMIGHSLGEYVAACLAGVFTREQAAAIVAARGRLMQAQPRGTMMAVALSVRDLEPLLPEGVVIAAYNAPTFNVVAGPDAEVKVFERQLTARNINCRPLNTSHAFHSPMMDGALEPFRQELEKAQLQAPTRPWISCVTGDWITAEQATDPEYWVKQLRNPVRFSDGVRCVCQDPALSFLEVGPGRALSTLVRQHSERPTQQAVITSFGADPANEMRSMLQALGALWIAGVIPDWQAFRRREQSRRVPLPTYPFDRKRHWVQSSANDVAPADDTAASSATPGADQTADPAAEVKARLRALLSEASGHPPDAIGSSQSFLELGFDSLLLNQVSASILKTFGVNVSLRQLLEQLATLDHLARHIHSAQPQSTPEQHQAAPTQPQAAATPQAPASDASEAQNAPATNTGYGATASSVGACCQPSRMAACCSVASPNQTATVAAGVTPITSVALDGPFPMSEAQREIWSVVQMGPEASCAYNQCFVVSLRGDVSLDAMKHAVQRIFERHDALRTRFDALGESQVIEPFKPVDIPHLDLGPIPSPDERKARFRAVLTEEVSKPLDLVGGPSARMRIVIEATDCAHLIITAHHIVFDGSSSVIFFRELAALYSAQVSGTSVDLPAATPFRRQVRHDESPQGRAQAAAALDYWRGLFADGAPSLELPSDHGRPPIKTYTGAREDRVLTKVMSPDVTRVASRLGATSVGLLLAVFQVLLYRLSGQSDVVVGLPLSARLADGGDTMMGHATNLLPIRARIDGRAPFADLVRQARTSLLDGHDHQCLTFGTLVGSLNLPRDMSRTPLVAAVFNVDRGRNAPTFEKSQATVAVAAREFVNFEVELQLVDTRQELILELAYNSDLFSGESIQRWLAHYEELLAAALAHPETPVDLLPILRGADREALRNWNRTELEYPRDVPLARLIEEQVNRSPEALAVLHDRDSVPYRELNARANQLAHALIAHGVGPDQLVGICIERSIDMVVGLLAIAKAGAAYVPLDPFYPRERIAYMVEDSGLKLILSQESLRSSLPEFSGAVVCVDDPALANNSRENPNVEVQPSHLAYVIYTSGSTGKPKGVAVPRGALVNLLWSMRDWLKLSSTDRLLGVTTISFDIAGVDMWLPLLVGAQLIVASREDAVDGARVQELIDTHKITFLQATPITWRLLLEAGWRGNRELQIVCTGEAMPRDLAAKLTPIVRRLWNLYGPTETTIWSTGYLVQKGDEPVLIGRPVANTQCHILDENRQQVPIGVVGELYIGGDGLARGYLHRPELTAEKFVRDPFSAAPDARMYRTGDLARYLPDGNIECLGRTDHQVKIRGFRIELGEIETILKKDARIAQAVVVAREDVPGQKQLVGYIVPIDAKAVPTRNDLRALLLQELPDYMVPSEYVVLSAIPISPNGKIDRKALPAPTTTTPVEQPALASDALPQTETERKVAAILCEVLRLPQVGRHDGFFDLGGHSLAATRAIARINQEFSLTLPVRILFAARTCAELAAQVDQRLTRPEESKEPETWPVLVPVQPSGSRVPLFCIARPNVNALGYITLARHLGADQPVYGLQAQLPEDPQIDFTRQQYEDTAREYLAAMRSIQPRGPYYVIGQCQGAYIAFEMARQLEASGDKFGWIGVLDAWTEENTRHKALFLAYVYGLAIRSRARRLRDKVQHLLRPEEVASKEAEVEAMVASLQGNPEFFDATTRSGLKRMLRLYFPGKEFTPNVIASNITVFSVGRPEFYRVRDDRMGWGDRTTGFIDVDRIPGHHLTILREPHVRVLAQKILTRLGSVR